MLSRKKINIMKILSLVLLVGLMFVFAACSTTGGSTTQAPTTLAPTTQVTTTLSPTTLAPTTLAPTTLAPTTQATTTQATTTQVTTTLAPTTTTTTTTTETPLPIEVESISVIGEEGLTSITEFEGTLQMMAIVLPEDAEDKTVLWSVENGTGEATISSSGLLTAVADGSVTVKATSVSKPTVFGTMEVTIYNQVVSTLQAVDLGSASTFAILGKTGISTTPTSDITGDLGVSPIESTAITGFSLTLDAEGEFSTSEQVTGKIYAADYAAPTPSFMTTVISDMEIAYNDASSRTPDFIELYAGDLSGKTLEAGVYKCSTDVVINTDLTLNGSSTDVWIFQISGSLSQAVAVNIILTGGALAENIFWQVAGDTSIGATAHFEGIILCMTSISLGTGATVNGKLFSQTAVTLDANIIVGV
jgi:hypothetical protein